MTSGRRDRAIRLWAALACCAALPSGAQSLHAAFETGYEGWIADFADYPAADSAAWLLRHGIADMPGAVPAQKGLMLAGNNFSDDLFLFIRKRVTGLVPQVEYRMTVTAVISTSQCPDCIGGDSFYLKAGATASEPRKRLEGGMYRMNIDKGNQARGGSDMDTLGFVRHAFTGDMKPHLTRMDNAGKPFRFRADAQGAAWIIVGVESAFETPVEWDLADLRIDFATASAVREPDARFSAFRAPSGRIRADGRALP